MPTNQETFEIVAKHLITQGKVSLGPTGINCAYRGDNGTKCAVGCLIPDEKYSSSLEGFSIQKYKYATFDGAINITALMQELGYDLKLLKSLQGVHDNNPCSDWSDALRSVASRFGLNTRVLDA